MIQRRTLKSMNAGLVCDNCGEPEWLHDGELCPTNAQIEAAEPARSVWHSIITPIRKSRSVARRQFKLSSRHAPNSEQARIAEDYMNSVHDCFERAVRLANITVSELTKENGDANNRLS